MEHRVRHKQAKSIDSIILQTYEQLSRYVQAFAAGHINLLILVGPPGLAKSRTVRTELPMETCWIEGNATAFGIYQQLYRHRDAFVVIDDVDSLYADKHGIRLLKCLCQTETQKSVAWHSASRMLERARIPREFTTSSRVIIICNDWRTLNRNVAALQDRGHVLEFQPTATEIHRKACEWFDDAEILQWYAANLHRVQGHSLRSYVRAAELKAAGLPWRSLISEAGCPRRRLVTDLKSDESFPLEKDRVERFIELGGGCRATYFNHARQLRGKML